MRGVLHRAHAVACASGGLHPHGSHAAAGALAGEQRICWRSMHRRCASTSTRHAASSNRECPGKLGASTHQVAVRQHRRLGGGAAHFGVGAGRGKNANRAGIGHTIRRVPAVRRLPRRHTQTSASRDGRVHAAHGDTRSADGVAVRGGDRRRGQPGHAGSDRRAPASARTDGCRRTLVPLSPSDARLPVPAA